MPHRDHVAVFAEYDVSIVVSGWQGFRLFFHLQVYACRAFMGVSIKILVELWKEKPLTKFKGDRKLFTVREAQGMTSITM